MSTHGRQAPLPVVLVHLARVGDGRWDVEGLLSKLSGHEQARARRFRDPLDRERFVVGHALLAATGIGARVRHVSLSHAGRMVAVAVATPGLALGIDVEPVDPTRGDRGVAARYLPPEVLSAYDAAPTGERPRLLATAWTALEAEAKGRGTTLDALRGRARTGWLRELDAGPDHVLHLWTDRPVTVLPEEVRLLASVA